MPHSSFMTRRPLEGCVPSRSRREGSLAATFCLRSEGLFDKSGQQRVWHGRFKIRKCNQVPYIAHKWQRLTTCKRNTICSLLDERCRFRGSDIVPEQQLILLIRGLTFLEVLMQPLVGRLDSPLLQWCSANEAFEHYNSVRQQIL